MEKKKEFEALIWKGSELIGELSSPVFYLIDSKHADLSTFFEYIRKLEDWIRDLKFFIISNIENHETFVEEIDKKLNLLQLKEFDFSGEDLASYSFNNEIKWTKNECAHFVLDVSLHPQLKYLIDQQFYRVKMSLQINYNMVKELLLTQAKSSKTNNIGNNSCGPGDKPQCDELDGIAKESFSNNIFLDIPYSNYEDCEEILIQVLKELKLTPIIAKDKLTSNHLLCKVCRQIKTCKYGITDISSGSNSVSYEYGLMHGYGMKVSLLRREESPAFTDITGLDHIPYKGLRDFKIKVVGWITQNIDEADKAKAQEIITSESGLLKDKGEIALKKIDTNRSDSEKKSKLKDSLIAEIRERAFAVKDKTKGKPSRLMFALPADIDKEISTTRFLSEKKDDFVIFPQSRAEFPCHKHELILAQKSLIYHKEFEGLSDFPVFRYFELSTYGLAFFEEAISEYGKNDWDKKAQTERMVGVIITLDRMYRFILLLNKFYEEIKYSGQVDLHYVLQNVKGLKLLSTDSSQMIFIPGQITLQDTVPITKTVRTEELKNNSDNIILDIYEEIRAAANVEEPYKRDMTRWQLEEVKWNLYGKDICPICQKHYKAQNQDKCLVCKSL